MNLKSKCWQFIVYPDNEDGTPNNHFPFADVISNLMVSGARFAYAYHDKDDNVPHFHFVCVWPNARYCSAVQAMTGHKSEFALLSFAMPDLADKIKYLTHKNAPDKYQYDDDIVHLEGFTEFDYDMFIRSTSTSLANESTLTMVDVCKAYIEHRVTLYQALSICPAIIHNVRNFLTMAEALRAEFSAGGHNAKSSAVVECQEFMRQWRDFNKGDNLL